MLSTIESRIKSGLQQGRFTTTPPRVDSSTERFCSTTNPIWSTIILMGMLACAPKVWAEPTLELYGQRVEAMIKSRGEASLRAFVKQNVSAALQESVGADKLLDRLKKMRRACASAGGVTWSAGEDGSLQIHFESRSSKVTVLVKVESQPPHKISTLEILKTKSRHDGKKQSRLTWRTLRRQLKVQERRGFHGTVLMVKDGEVVLHEGYGKSDRENNVPNGKATIFAVGSTPIDFTKGAILKLEEMGKIKTSDKITKYFSKVPADKQRITLDHLMSGRSGLQNFHHILGEDKDHDLSWIDRDTAVLRILAKELLFDPGSSEVHSHSAWGLLAAIVEIASGQSYEEFLQQHFFDPAGMTQTGFYQAAANLDRKASVRGGNVAVGYEGLTPFGKINSPLYWGNTSWLVLGSGGMVSSPGDLYKWTQAIRTNKTLSRSASRKYDGDGVFVGGNIRGFLCFYAIQGDSMMFLCCNSHSNLQDNAMAFAKDLGRLTMN